ncbi:hypothetical protein SB782_33925, partial [Brevibacillus sp. SIMBA_076]|uniref:hypothetical protein n=1 Tax=Brevibacillus sp. SIMBA_076 TaxID=3085814 RepID=UPI003979A02C
MRTIHERRQHALAAMLGHLNVETTLRYLDMSLHAVRQSEASERLYLFTEKAGAHFLRGSGVETGECSVCAT